MVKSAYPFPIHYSPPEDAEDVGEVVAPDFEFVDRGVELAPLRVGGERPEVFGVAGDGDPRRGVVAELRPLPAVVEDARGVPGLPRDAARDALELEAAVRDVESDDAPGRELRDVERERLARHEVRGHGVGAEGVEDDEVVSAVGRLAQTQARVAEDDVRPRARARREVGEELWVTRDVNDHRVDLVERPRLAGARVRGRRPRAEPDDGDRQRRAHRRRAALRADVPEDR